MSGSFPVMYWKDEAGRTLFVSVGMISKTKSDAPWLNEISSAEIEWFPSPSHARSRMLQMLEKHPTPYNRELAEIAENEARDMRLRRAIVRVLDGQSMQSVAAEERVTIPTIRLWLDKHWFSRWPEELAGLRNKRRLKEARGLWRAFRKTGDRDFFVRDGGTHGPGND